MSETQTAFRSFHSTETVCGHENLQRSAVRGRWWTDATELAADSFRQTGRRIGSRAVKL